MALDYLSDDEFTEIYGRAERKARREARRRRREERRKRKAKGEKKAARKKRRRDRRRKRSEGRKDRPRRIARIALAPARGAFLTVVRLNGLKLATKLARVYNKPGGKKQLQTFWRKFGGKKWPVLARTISKGSKQQISDDEIGQVLATVIATALPIIIAVVKIVKKFKAEGGSQEKGLLSRGIKLGKELLSRDESVEKGEAYFDEGEEVAVMERDDFKDERDIDERPRFSFFSLAGILWKMPLILMFWNTGYFVLDLLITTVSTYCIIGLILLPLEMRNVKAVHWYFKPFKFLGHGKSNSKTHG